MNGLESLSNSLSTLAQNLSADITIMRGITHHKFDQLWKSGRMSRSAAYCWLARQMKMNSKDAHIEFFDLKQCAKVIRCVERNFPEFK